jgi:two-component system sensor histidine kinase KdpD
VEVRLSEDLPLVNADQMLIEQALVQCLDNAVKYSPRGSTIWVEARSSGGQTLIEIRDEGLGFAAEEREQLFERLYRGARARETTSGSGLGLWIARSFVVACGGRIEIGSAGPGAGTVVRIILQEAQMAPAGADGGLDE